MADKRRSEPFIEDADRFPSSPRKDRRPPSPDRRPPASDHRPPAGDQDARRRKAQQRRRRNSVFQYIAILFCAAFLLLLFTFMMERRQSQQQIDDLKQSASALQTLQGMIQTNEQLKNQVAELESQSESLQQRCDQLEEHSTAAQQAQSEAEKSLQAMDWFWQINEAYVRGRYKLCRELIQSIEAAGLQGSLPKESITDNNRFSPADRYQEIRDKLIK